MIEAWRRRAEDLDLAADMVRELQKWLNRQDQPPATRWENANLAVELEIAWEGGGDRLLYILEALDEVEGYHEAQIPQLKALLKSVWPDAWTRLPHAVQTKE